MIWRERLIRIEAWFAPACFVFEAPLLVVRPASWWLPVIGGAAAVRALVRRRQLWVAQHSAALPAVRAPAFPVGVGCPPGCCPVCGQHDPDRLERCWGHLDAHPSCAEWVGELPLKLAAGRESHDAHLLREVKKQRRIAEQAACPHRDIRALNDQTDVCWDCFAVQRPIPEPLIQKPTPPPGPGPASPRAK